LLDKRVFSSKDGFGGRNGRDDLVLEIDIFCPGVVIVDVFC
jgi:hypothetical protein